MKNKEFQFMMPSRPKDMTPMEQVICMMYLSNIMSLPGLRIGQTFIQEQLETATREDNFYGAVADLIAMQKNYDAAVAYKEFEDNFWIRFIN